MIPLRDPATPAELAALLGDPSDPSGPGGVDWQLFALCAEADPEAFYPEKGGSTREAKRICAACEVRAECLDYALAHDERFGVWGGMSARERRRLTRATADVAPAEPFDDLLDDPADGADLPAGNAVEVAA